MFARTDRLLLRPAWPDDAPALATALADGRVARTTSRIPYPYRLADAEAFVARPHVPTCPTLLILERGAGAPRLVGGIGLDAQAAGVMLGYWIHPDCWGRGYATEAGHAMIAIADMLGIDRLCAVHRLDNPASGAVLAKLGFGPTLDMVPPGDGASDAVPLRYTTRLRAGAAAVRALAA